MPRSSSDQTFSTATNFSFQSLASFIPSAFSWSSRSPMSQKSDVGTGAAASVTAREPEISGRIAEGDGVKESKERGPVKTCSGEIWRKP